MKVYGGVSDILDMMDSYELQLGTNVCPECGGEIIGDINISFSFDNNGVIDRDSAMLETYFRCMECSAEFAEVDI